MLGSLVGSILAVLCYALIFTYAGIGVLKRIISPNAIPGNLLFSCSYFVGMSLFISVWCLTETLVGSALLSLVLVLVLFLIVGIVGKAHVEMGVVFRQLQSHKLLLIMAFTLFPILFCVSRVVPDPFNIDTALGSASAALYFNRALFIVNENMIPGITNSLGQTLLASAVMFLGLKSAGVFTLFLWLYMNLLMLAPLFFFFFVFAGVSRRNAVMGVLILIFGNLSLSLFPTIVVDSGMPFIESLYAHSNLTSGIFIVVMTFVFLALRQRLRANVLTYLVAILLMAAWCITSPENIVIGIPAFVIFCGFLLFRRKVNLRQVGLWLVAIAMGLFLGVSQGGLLSPACFRDLGAEQTIPGWQSSPVSKPFSFQHPGMDYCIIIAPNIFALQYPSGQRFHQIPSGNAAVPNLEFKGQFLAESVKWLASQEVKDLFGRILIWEVEAWNLLKLLFFPIFGVFWLGLRCLQSKSEDEPDGLRLFFVAASAVVLTGGILMVFVPYQEGIKWPFTRFLLPAVTPAMISFCLALFDWDDQAPIRPLIKRSLVAVLMMFLVGGRFATFGTRVIANAASTNSAGETFLVRAKRMFTTSEYIQ